MIVCCNPLALASLLSWGDLEGWAFGQAKRTRKKLCLSVVSV